MRGEHHRAAESYQIADVEIGKAFRQAHEIQPRGGEKHRYPDGKRASALKQKSEQGNENYIAGGNEARFSRGRVNQPVLLKIGRRKKHRAAEQSAEKVSFYRIFFSFREYRFFAAFFVRRAVKQGNNKNNDSADKKSRRVESERLNRFRACVLRDKSDAPKGPPPIKEIKNFLIFS
jgi:hypothetical protein